MRGADVGDGLRRQDQGVAGDGVDLFRRHGAARQQLRRAAEEVADLERAFGGVLDPANRAGLALDLDYRFRESCHKRGIHLSFQAPICAGALRTKD
jgi:hypothetical protein